MTDLADTPSSSPANQVTPAGESLVNVCAAADCRYNRDRSCRAGAVSIAFVAGRPICATYSPVPAPPDDAQSTLSTA